MTLSRVKPYLDAPVEIAAKRASIFPGIFPGAMSAGALFSSCLLLA
jgi:hypothetical protein